jgi:hypothetical protein
MLVPAGSRRTAGLGFQEHRSSRQDAVVVRFLIGGDMNQPNPQHSAEAAITETEDQLIDRAQTAVSSSNWIVGECASKWTRKYARGRTDSDFGQMLGLSGDQVFQRRRVFETFGDVYQGYEGLKWSHFYVALNWDDAPECLQWALEQDATVAEMKAWRRAQRGEDLTQETPLDEWASESALNLSSADASVVRDPSEFAAPGAGGERPPFDVDRDPADTVPAFAREFGGAGDEYVPFRNTAGSPAPGGDGGDTVLLERPKPAADVLVKRWISTLNRMQRQLDEELISEIRKLPEKDRTLFVEAVGELAEKVTAAGF